MEHPYVPRGEILAISSLCLNVPVKNIAEASSEHIMLCSSNMFRNLQRNSINVSVSNRNISSYTMFITPDKKILLQNHENQGSSSRSSRRLYDERLATMYCIAFLLEKYGIDDIKDMTGSIAGIVYKHMNIIDSINEQTRRISSNVNEIKYLVQGMSIMTFEPKRADKFVKSLKRKYNVLGAIEGRNIKLTFKKLKVGNDVEGYINYKRLYVYIDKATLHVVRVVFEFPSGFMFDPHWGITNPFVYHPHISSDCSSVCYGNQSDNINTYMYSNNIEMFIDTLIEVIRGYNPGSGGEGPYQSVTRILQSLGDIENLWKGLKDYSNPEEASKTIITQLYGQRRQERNRRTVMPPGVMSLRLTGCPHCGEDITQNSNGTGYICTNTECHANVMHIEHCSCGETMSSYWDYHDLSYQYYCTNEDCITGPVNVFDNRPICPICGEQTSFHSEDDDSWYQCDECSDVIFDRDRRLESTDFLASTERLRRDGSGNLYVEDIPDEDEVDDQERILAESDVQQELINNQPGEQNE